LELPFKRVIEGRIEVTGRRGRRHKQLLEDLKEKKGYWKLKETAVDPTVWRTLFWKTVDVLEDCGPVVRQTAG
jgi:hypothetical protein